MSEENDVRLMFIGNKDFADGEAVRGGMLVTDAQTKPLEFRCTDPIRPTSLQKVLYGKMLDAHVLVTLIAGPLVRSASERPDLVLIRDTRLLDLQEKVQFPVIWLGRNEEDFGSASDEEGSPLITSETGKFEPVVMRGTDKKREEITQIRELLSRVFASRNLLEPFDRIGTALEQVHKEKMGVSQ